MNIPDVRVVLVRPRNPLNIGACARAMSNFGFKDLVVVDPYEPIWRETRSAPDAQDVVLKARKVKTLELAVKGWPLVLGTSSFAHRNLEHAVVSLPLLKTCLRKGKRVAIVFGSERSGLSNDELSHCHAVVQIESRGSMNLAQAAAVVFYELTRKNTSKSDQTHRHSPHEDVIQSWIKLAESVDYPPGYTPAARAGRIRRLLQPVALTGETAHFLKSFAHWLAKKKTHRFRSNRRAVRTV